MNGFLSNFMVYPVQMVASPTKLKRENRQSGQRHPGSSASDFRRFLEEAASEDCPAECYVVTYNANCQLQTYSYRSREYTF